MRLWVETWLLGIPKDSCQQFLSLRSFALYGLTRGFYLRPLQDTVRFILSLFWHGEATLLIDSERQHLL